MNDLEEHIGRLFSAELQFRLASAVRVAATMEHQPLDVPLEWSHGRTLYVRENVMSAKRDAAIDAVDVLNDLITDLVAGTNVFRDYRQRVKSGSFRLDQMSAVQKMCFSHLALAFCKLLEFWEHYHSLVPVIHRKELKRLNREIRKRDVEYFRNKVAGHVWDKKLQRPLRHSEIMTKLAKLVGEHADHFLNWINNAEDNTYPKTVVSVVETIRDAIAKEHAINPSEIIER